MKNKITTIVTVMLTCSLIFSAGSAAAKPKSPILIVASNNHFGSYTSEILKAEGFSEFKMESLDSNNITENYLKNFGVVILTEMPLTILQKEMFTSYVKEGGNLIAFRP